MLPSTLLSGTFYNSVADLRDQKRDSGWYLAFKDRIWHIRAKQELLPDPWLQQHG